MDPTQQALKTLELVNQINSSSGGGLSIGQALMVVAFIAGFLAIIVLGSWWLTPRQ
jgi:hypothetical protein